MGLDLFDFRQRIEENNSSSIAISCALIVIAIQVFFPNVFAEVFIPENEFIGYFDSNGIYTVIGSVKNHENYPIIPTISITITDEKDTISKDFLYVNIMPGKEIPFKFKFPEVKSEQPILNEPILSFIRGVHNPIPVEVIYDKSLKKHDDGHITGRIINNGDSTLENVQIFAKIHGAKNEVLDMGQNIMPIHNLKPGEIREFSIVPEKTIAAKVSYYSCFAPSDGSVIPVTAIRNGEKFYFRYDSGSWYAYAEFNEVGTELKMRTQNSYPIETYANFEFPVFTSTEKFDVKLNDKQIQSIQSIDEMGNWHVAFQVAPYDSGTLKITGFAENYFPKESEIPIWIKDNASWWSTNKITDDEFISGLEFMIKSGIISIPPVEKKMEAEQKVPNWIKNNAGWWSQDMISDKDFVNGLQYLISREIIKV